MIETNRDRRHFYTRINLLLDVVATSVIYYLSVAIWLGIIKQDSEEKLEELVKTLGKLMK